MMVSEIKLTAAPNQTITITIPGDDRNLSLTLTFSYNKMAGYWVLGIYDTTAGSPYVLGIPLLRGHDLLGHVQYMRIGSAYVMNTGDPTIRVPDDTNIADNFTLVWVL